MQPFCVFVLLAAVIAVTTFKGVDGFGRFAPRTTFINEEALKIVNKIDDEVNYIYNVTYEGFRHKTKDVYLLGNGTLRLIQKEFDGVKVVMQLKESSKMKELRRQGHDVGKFSNCLDNKKERLNQNIQSEQKQINECVESGTQKARRKIYDVRDKFNEKTIGISKVAGITVGMLNDCFAEKSTKTQNLCAQIKKSHLEDKVKEISDLSRDGLQQVANVEKHIKDCRTDLKTVIGDLEKKHAEILEKCSRK